MNDHQALLYVLNKWITGQELTIHEASLIIELILNRDFVFANATTVQDEQIAFKARAVEAIRSKFG